MVRIIHWKIGQQNTSLHIQGKPELSAHGSGGGFASTASKEAPQALEGSTGTLPACLRECSIHAKGKQGQQNESEAGYHVSNPVSAPKRDLPNGYEEDA